MKDIILATINAKWIHPSLALRLLKANLGDLEDRVLILEFALRQSLDEKTEQLLAALSIPGNRPKVLGLSVSIWNHTATLDLLKYLNKKWNSYCDVNQNTGIKPVVVLGGPEVSWLPEESEIFCYADYVIRGEGEENFRSLCSDILSGKTACTQSAVFINCGKTTVDLDKIKTAYHLYTEEDVQKKLVYVESSRGCPFSCGFCQGNKTGKVREFELEPFLEAMEILIDKGTHTFKFLDRSFNTSTDRAIRIMKFFLERIENPETEKPPPFCVHFEMFPSRFPPEMKEVIRRFPPGTLRLELGIQTFNPYTASLVKRLTNPETELEALKFLRSETNAIVHADLIAGLPGEDFESFGAGLDRLWRVMSGTGSHRSQINNSFEIQLGILKCLPGSLIARESEIFRIKYSAMPPYEVLETGALSAPELDRIKNFARLWELIVNRNPFPDLVIHLAPPGENIFERFINLSDKILERFGRNWGLDRNELKAYCEEHISLTL